jgi:His-Xaa-Ser system protein HxsD
MRVIVNNSLYSKNAVLVAVKKQQGFADWKIEDYLEDSTIVAFSKTNGAHSKEECEQRFRQQLEDEQIREGLEERFGQVRDLLVSAALSPIINMKV